MPRILLHACCGPCAGHAIELLRGQGNEVTLLFANANLAASAEFEKRLAAVRQLAEYMVVPLLIDRPDHAAWLEAIKGMEDEPEGGKRCRACFRYNLGRANARLADSGCEVFTTSLSISPLKCAQDIMEAGQAAGGARFLSIVFRKNHGFQHGVALSKKIGLYRQKECGCEFSRRQLPEVPAKPHFTSIP